MEKIRIFSLCLSFFILICSSFTVITYFYVLYPLKYKDEILIAGKINNISPSLIASLINEESSFDNLCESKAGAIGLMQIMPKTAEWLAVRMGLDNYNEKQLFEPKFNIDMGTFYLRYLLDRFNDEYTALCAYNAGEGTVREWLNNTAYSLNSKTLSKTPFAETNSYASKVLINIDRYETRFQIKFM